MKRFIFILFFLFAMDTLSIDFIPVGSAKLEENVLDGSYDKNYDGFYRLTSNGRNEKGAIWSTQKVDLNSPFIIEFLANFGNNDIGADGIAFVWHKDTRNIDLVIGSHGERIGYAGISTSSETTGQVENSVGLEFDTYYNNTPTKDLSVDHFDIIRNGELFKLTSARRPIFGDEELEDGDDKQIQIVWIPSLIPNIGKLTVLFNCRILFEDEQFEIDKDMEWDNTLNFVNFGLTAATGDYENYHRVKLLLPELELSSEQLCGNIQLEANFPNLCGTFQYRWTAADGSNSGLINPNTKNPIAFKSGTYTCTVTEVNSSYIWSAYIDAVFDEDITATPSVPEYSYSKIYNNRLNINNSLVSLNDAVCGTQLSYDCGYLISAWSGFKLDPNYENGAGAWLLKTNYLGEIDFSKYYIATNGLDLATVTDQAQEENYRFHTIIHNVINDFRILGTKGVACTNPLDPKLAPEKENVGYFLSGETKKYFSELPIHNLPATRADILFSKIDENGELINSVAFDHSNGNDWSLKTLQREDDKYVSLNYHADYPDSPVNGSIIGLCYSDGLGINSFNLLNQFGFVRKNDFYLYFENSDFISLPKPSNSPIRSDYINIIAVPYKILETTYGIAVLKLDDVINSSSSNIILANNSITSGTDEPNSNRAKVLYNEKDPSHFYVVTKRRISKFDFNLAHIYTKELIYPNNFYVNYLSNAVVVNSNSIDKIELMVSGNGIKEGQLIVSYDITNNQILPSVRYNYPFNNPFSQSFDNLNSINNGLAFAGIKINPQSNNDVILTSHNYNQLGCTTSEDVSIQPANVTVNTTSFVDVVDLNMTAYDPGLVKIEHFPQYKGLNCIDVEFCTCEDLDENSLELYTVAKPRDFDNSDCCFDVFIKNKGNCKLTGYDLTITQSEYGQKDDLPPNKTIIMLQVNSSLKIGEICLADGIDEVDISVKLKKQGQSEFCLNDEFEPLTFNTSVTCFEGCCDYIKVNFIPSDPEGSNCCWTPNITSTNPLCSVNDVSITYQDSQNQRIDLNENGELCLDPLNPNSHSFSYVITVNGDVCELRSVDDLECGMCDCPDDFIKASWLKVELDKNSPMCPGGKCASKVTLDIPEEYQNCFTHFKMLYVLKDKNGVEITHSNLQTNQIPIPINGILPFVPPCVNEGERLSVRVRLYGNSTSNIYCELNSAEIICDKIDNIERTEPCEVDNPLDEWSNEKLILTKFGGCDYIVKFVYRLTSDGFQDVQLTSYEKVDKNCITTATGEDIIKDALPKAIAEILSNETNWNPKNQSPIKCSNIWRVVQNSCWVTFLGINEETEFTLTEPCISDCCARQLRVCINPLGEISVEDIGFAKGSSTFNCSAQPVPPQGETNPYISNTGCQDLNCDIFTDYSGETHQPYYNRVHAINLVVGPGLGPKRVNDNLINNKSLLLYQIYNDNDVFRLFVKETKFESLTLEIYNIKGNLVKSDNFNNITNGSIIETELESLISGTYLVNIIGANGVKGTYKLQLIK